MISEKLIRVTAAERRGMTLDELAVLVQEAMRAGAAGTERVSVRTTWGGGLRSAEVTVDTPPHPKPSTSG